MEAQLTYLPKVYQFSANGNSLNAYPLLLGNI